MKRKHQEEKTAIWAKDGVITEAEAQKRAMYKCMLEEDLPVRQAVARTASDIYPVKFLLSFLHIFSFFFFYVKLFVECVSDPEGPSQFCAVYPRVPSRSLTADVLPSPGRDTDLPG